MIRVWVPLGKNVLIFFFFKNVFIFLKDVLIFFKNVHGVAKSISEWENTSNYFLRIPKGIYRS